ncbi:MAG: RnfABCDGE type electron transport complex subunit G [Candidatus Omnitrophota bacterium]|nr:RnfABCDGE type electron transport complex subunit G [Candidatus Omnitrophota bacterium]
MFNIFKNTFVKMIVALTAVSVVSGVSLVLVYNYSMPKIKVNIEREKNSAIKNIFPGAVKIEKTGKEEIFRVTDKTGKLLGYAFIAKGNGYQGEIKLIVGVDPEIAKMQGMEVIESQETPGLGAEIAGEKFREQFQGLSITHDVEYIKNRKPQQPYQIEAITGATISSRAVVNIINERIHEVRRILKGG